MDVFSSLIEASQSVVGDGFGPWLVSLVSVMWVLGTTNTLAGFFFLSWYLKRKAPPLKLENLPKVSIVKPCYTADDNEEENFRRFFQQDYPGEFEILFAVTRETDPVVPVIKRAMARFPNIPAKLVLSNSRRAFWRKVDGLYDAHQEATGDIVIWTDSDTVVHPNYLREMVAGFQNPDISAVTSPQFDIGMNNFPSALKSLANNADIVQFVLGYGWWHDFRKQHAKMGFGQSIAFRKKTFDGFGDEIWAFMFRFLADDVAVPHFFGLKGLRTEVHNIYCPVWYAGKTLKSTIRQKIRWVHCQKLGVSNTFIYLQGAYFYPEVPALLMCLLTGFHPWALGLFAIAAGSRILLSFVTELTVLNSVKPTLKWFWTVPFWDLMQPFFFAFGALNTQMQFDGVRYKVVNRYFLEKVTD